MPAFPDGRVSRAAKGADCKSAGYAFVGSSPTSPTIPLQATDLTTISATITQGCRATVSHADAAETAISVCNRYENSRADCHTNLPDKRAANRRKHRPTDIWLRGTVWQFRVRPRRAGSEPPKNAIDDPPIVNARHAARLVRQQRLKDRPFLVRQFKAAARHQGPQRINWGFESSFSVGGKPVYEFRT